MKLLRSTFVVLLVGAIASKAAAQTKPATPKDPLVLANQGSFFVGGENKTVAGGEITVNQMYVQYQIPVNAGQQR